MPHEVAGRANAENGPCEPLESHLEPTSASSSDGPTEAQPIEGVLFGRLRVRSSRRGFSLLYWVDEQGEEDPAGLRVWISQTFKGYEIEAVGYSFRAWSTLRFSCPSLAGLVAGVLPEAADWVQLDSNSSAGYINSWLDLIEPTIEGATRQRVSPEILERVPRTDRVGSDALVLVELTRRIMELIAADDWRAARSVASQYSELIQTNFRSDLKLEWGKDE